MWREKRGVHLSEWFWRRRLRRVNGGDARSRWHWGLRLRVANLPLVGVRRGVLDEQHVRVGRRKQFGSHTQSVSAPTGAVSAKLVSAHVYVLELGSVERRDAQLERERQEVDANGGGERPLGSSAHQMQGARPRRNPLRLPAVPHPIHQVLVGDLRRVGSRFWSTHGERPRGQTARRRNWVLECPECSEYRAVSISLWVEGHASRSAFQSREEDVRAVGSIRTRHFQRGERARQIRCKPNAPCYSLLSFKRVIIRCDADTETYCDTNFCLIA